MDQSRVCRVLTIVAFLRAPDAGLSRDEDSKFAGVSLPASEPARNSSDPPSSHADAFGSLA